MCIRDRTRIVAAADRDDKRRQSFGGKWDVPGLYKDWQEMLNTEKLNTTDRGRCVIPLSVEEIVESLDRDQDTISTGEDGRAALEMVLSLHESERLGNARVDFSMTNLDLQVLVRNEGFISDAVPQ